MSTDDVIFAVGLAVLFAAGFATLFDLAPLIAKAMVHQAARWWKPDLDTPEQLAEELEALVEARPVGVLKISTAVGFLMRGALRQGQSVLKRGARQGLQLRLNLAGFKAPLIWLSGARKDVLTECPSEISKYRGMGASVLISAMITAVSLIYALRTVLNIAQWLTLLLAFASGLAILILVRWCIFSLKRQERHRGYLSLAPRLLLCLSIGIVISVPFPLRVFAPEIEKQISVIQHQRSDAFFSRLATSPISKEINQERAMVSALQRVASSTARVKSKQAARSISELPAAERALHQKEFALESIKAGFIRANENDHGFSIWLQAFDEIASQNGTLGAARWLLIMLFAQVISMPVLIKALILLGPESAYDKLAASSKE
jgi:hypothetical protein